MAAITHSQNPKINRHLEFRYLQPISAKSLLKFPARMVLLSTSRRIQKTMFPIEKPTSQARIDANRAN
ncbi:MAG: hypothetical protein M3Y27_28040, partial [Acidobacteriota bacterium]|nr:hypothetical protein [Acidobacteriota bacterium]